MDRVVINNNAAKHVQAYLDQVNVVGDTNGDQLLSEAEYEALKKKMVENAKNRLQCSWRNARNVDCKMVGPATKCFCDHRFKDHEYMNPRDKSTVHCKVPKCKCRCFDYIPTQGSYDFKCLCKHSYKLHDPLTKKCTQGKCGGCHVKFSSTWTCSCGSKYTEHVTVFESRQERLAQGKPIDDMIRLGNELDVPQMHGGLNSFQALADGVDRYEEQINQLGYSGNNNAYQQKALTGPTTVKPKAINNKAHLEEQRPSNDQDRKRGVLYGLNDRISMAKKEDYGMNTQEQEEDIQEQEGIDDQKAATALDLYRTPHMYSRIKMPLKIQGSKKY